jgi:hypothetical protein
LLLEVVIVVLEYIIRQDVGDGSCTVPERLPVGLVLDWDTFEFTRGAAIAIDTFNKIWNGNNE